MPTRLASYARYPTVDAIFLACRTAHARGSTTKDEQHAFELLALGLSGQILRDDTAHWESQLERWGDVVGHGDMQTIARMIGDASIRVGHAQVAFATAAMVAAALPQAIFVFWLLTHYAPALHSGWIAAILFAVPLSAVLSRHLFMDFGEWIYGRVVDRALRRACSRAV